MKKRRKKLFQCKWECYWLMHLESWEMFLFFLSQLIDCHFLAIFIWVYTPRLPFYFYLTRKQKMFFLGKIHLGPVVLRADSDIQWINCYSADNCLPIYPVDSIIHTLNNPGLIHRVKSIFCLFIVGMSVIIPVS